ncbi:TPA: ead/Ea22-like family protein [Klebsiella quasipneumoniae subsp. similipneumoniae]|uniref:ead/Ea22-like family protein n=1 Tax=Klebsiella quasipneumoniae TaxID=1463165 RepID=UPI000E06AAC7|nr:ead/Ea22-like family protein [Klebsiella quasipneumoniae]BBR05503.1 hypothetical protein WP3S18C02_27730 [Klebsiella quasipneumoniae]STR06983.1 Ead domain protein [Klebsiella quasipneumoniae]HBQ3471784.1 ead/Ea22-like family protein [Klebsiella quasipneumoniae subsp. similipneumoniae]
MTTDITEQAQSLKAAAEKAGLEKWTTSYLPPFGRHFIVSPAGKTIINLTDGEVPANCARFIALANPANVTALVEALEKSESRLHEVAVACATAEQALEKAQQRIGKLEKKLTDHKRMNQEMAKAMLTPNDSDAAGMEIAALRQRIAELESRTVKLPHRKLGHDKLFLLCPFPYYDAEDMEKALAAASIKVEAE